MSPEPEKRIREQEPNSEICANPEIILEKVRVLSEHPKDKAGRAIFRDWLLRDWAKINSFILQFDPEIVSANGQNPTIRSAALGNYNIYRRDPSSESRRSGFLQEEAPLFSGFKGIDRVEITLSHESYKTDSCKKRGGQDVRMEVLFVADSEKRDNLIGLNITVKETDADKRFKGIREYFEVKISPKLEIAKMK